MIDFDLLRDRKILVIKPDGPLEAADFERLTKAVDPFIASNEKLAGIMLEAKSFPGWESFEAFLSHLKFVADHHRRIERVAVVSDSELLRTIPRIADHFVQAEIKTFDSGQKDRALAWLESGR